MKQRSMTTSTTTEVSMIYPRIIVPEFMFNDEMLLKHVVKHKSAKLFKTYAVGKLEAALNISHLILSASSQRVS